MSFPLPLYPHCHVLGGDLVAIEDGSDTHGGFGDKGGMALVARAESAPAGVRPRAYVIDY